MMQKQRWFWKMPAAEHRKQADGFRLSARNQERRCAERRFVDFNQYLADYHEAMADRRWKDAIAAIRNVEGVVA